MLMSRTKPWVLKNLSAVNFFKCPLFLSNIISAISNLDHRIFLHSRLESAYLFILRF